MSSFFIVIAALVGVVFSAEVQNSDDARDMCDVFKNCSCFKIKEYEIQCPSQADVDVVINLLPDKYLNIDCYSQIDYKFNSIPDVDVNVDSILLRFCMLPADKFQHVLKKFSIHHLKTLNLEDCVFKNNSLSQIDSSFFEGLVSLQSLSIINASKKFKDNLFENLPNLIELYLDQNKLTEIGYIFENNPKLKVLHLSRNSLNSLPNGVFKKLTDLQQLHLWTNELANISKNYFIGLKSLKSLELSANVISYLEESAFSELAELVNISLRSNKLGTIESNTFKYNYKIENIRLGGNPNLLLKDYVFANLTSLKTINLDQSYLKKIPENAFQNCTNLISLEFQNNLIEDLPQFVFKSLKKLYTLNLSKNKIKLLPDNVFTSLENLRELNLESNHITSLAVNTFEGLNKLEYLNIRKNRISDIDNSAFSVPKGLIRLDLSHNLLTDLLPVEDFILIPYSSLFSHLEKLEQLFLSYNNFGYFPEDIMFSLVNLKLLDLSHNNVFMLSVTSLVKVSNYNVKVNLSNNNISLIDFQEAEIIAVANKPEVPSNNPTTTQVDISKNPLICDCRNFDLVQYLKGNINSVRGFADIRVKDMKCYKPEHLKNIRVKDLDPKQISCEYNGNDCPKVCSCFDRSYDKAVVVDCSFKNLTQLPNLTLEQSRVEVNLTGNFLKVGPMAGQGYKMVRNLFLSNNEIKSLDWCPPHIEELTLDHNLLNSLSNDVLKTFNLSTNLTNLNLGDNPWMCGCSALDLQNFLKTQFKKVKIKDIICESDNTTLVDKKLICKTKGAIIAQIVIPILVVFLIASILIALYFRYKQEIKIWLFSKNLCLWFVTEEELDKDKKYDIFLSFSHKDEDFVADNLVPLLEKSFKLCIHSRDWVPGELINDQIIDSVYKSRRTLVVLSNNFLESAWGKLEFLMAHKQSIEEGRTRVIVIKLGELNADKMTDDFKTYIRTNTYIEWGDPWFWKKLLYALPHSSKYDPKKNQKHVNMMLKIDDKFQLASQPISFPDSTPPVVSMDISLLKKHPLNFSNSSNINTLQPKVPLIKT